MQGMMTNFEITGPQGGIWPNAEGVDPTCYRGSSVTPPQTGGLGAPTILVADFSCRTANATFRELYPGICVAPLV